MMKNFFHIIPTFLLLSAAWSQDRSVLVTVENPDTTPRIDAIVSLDLHGMFWQQPEHRTGTFSVVEGREVRISQAIDDNADGMADELIFQATFTAHETKQFVVTASSGTGRSFPSKVDCRFVPPREDLAWENDRVAFRMYGPALAAEVKSGIDVWTKRVRYLIVEKWYEGEERTPKIVYHIDHGEGADFFNVGRSLGAGGSALIVDDTLRQSGVFSSYRILANGPLRTMFELYYDPVIAGKNSILAVKRISLDAGSQLNKVEDTFIMKYPSDHAVAAIGLVKRPHTELTRGERWMSLWGATTDDPVNGDLGTAVIVPGDGTVTASEDSLQYLMIRELGRNSSMTYYTGAAWTRMGDVKGDSEWRAYLESFFKSLKNPLKVTVQ